MDITERVRAGEDLRQRVVEIEALHNENAQLFDNLQRSEAALPIA
ncbi:hypothetical protein [Oscillochloris sp. ZM17-4]|nr:hypothetical protein [Oscillochloris sp. ZM17-4]